MGEYYFKDGSYNDPSNKMNTPPKQLTCFKCGKTGQIRKNSTEKDQKDSNTIDLITPADDQTVIYFITRAHQNSSFWCHSKYVSSL